MDNLEDPFRAQRLRIFLSGQEDVEKIIMPLASKNVARTLLFITTVLITVTNVYGSKEKRLDLKIGFDLVSGPNGVPSLRIRDFEESQEPTARANAGYTENKTTTPKAKGQVRADSFSDSKEQEQTKETTLDTIKSNEDAKSDDDDPDNSTEEENGKISTRGLKAEEYEPEENPRSIHKQQDSDDGSDNEDRRRLKRHALFDTFVTRQRKWRKFL